MKASLVFLILLFGCTGTRVGNPNGPDGEVPMGYESLDIDPDRIKAMDTAEGVRISGMPGAAPPDSEVRAAPLDEAAMYESEPVQEDGSFTMTLEAAAFGSNYLVQAISDKGLSEAVFVTTFFGPANIICFEPIGLKITEGIEPGADIDLVLTSACDLEQPAQVALHPLSQGVELRSEASPSVGDGSIIRLGVTAASGEAYEGTVVVRVGDQTLLGSVAGTVK